MLSVGVSYYGVQHAIKIFLLTYLLTYFSALICLQRFDAVGWVAGRASSL